MAFDPDEFDRVFLKTLALANLKTRLLLEGNKRWQSFSDDVRRIADQGVALMEAIDLAKRNYRPVVPALVPPPPPPPMQEVPKEERPKGSVPWRKLITWVFENVRTEYVDPREAPSMGAWGLLQWVQSSTANMGAFYSTIWPKILPTKAQIDEMYGREEETDDLLISDIDGYLNDLDAELVAEGNLESARAAGVPDEPPLPAETAGESPEG